MWKALAQWMAALLVTAAMAVAVLGAAEWIEGRGAAVEASAGLGTIVVDAGHGGDDNGAVGTRTQVAEAGLNLAVAKRVETLLTARGFSVVMTRATDEALAGSKQADMAARRDALNGANVSLAVSIHMNAFPDGDISGPMAYYMAGSAEGQRLAQSVIDALSDALDRPRRLANPGDYFVLRECACPAVLVECGFLSNAEDEKKLSDPAHQEALARAIADGVAAYWAGAGAGEQKAA